MLVGAINSITAGVEPYNGSNVWLYTEVAMKYAVVRIWKDNPNDCEVVEYVPTRVAGFYYIMGQKKSTLFNWEVRKYE